MTTASPIVRAFNAGLFSDLMPGRTDHAKYPASMREVTNCINTAQGPLICRSGTKFTVPAYTDAETSNIRPFIFSNEQAQLLEFCKDRIRFIDESGIQVYAPVAITVSNSIPMKIVTAAMGLAVVGSQVALGGFPANYNLNGVIANITAIVGTTYTLDINYPVQPIVAGVAELVYHVLLPYNEAQRQQLRVLQDVDIMYFMCETLRTKKLSRYGAYDWRFGDVNFSDGPYLSQNITTTTLTPSVTGNAIPDMTTNTAPSGTCTGGSKRAVVAPGGTFLGRVIPLGLAVSDYFQAFDVDDTTYWASNVQQSEILEYDPVAAFTCDGYVIYPARDNQDVTYIATDYAPGTWAFEGWNGSVWVILDHQEDYQLYDNDRSVFFSIAQPISCTKYRLRIIKCKRNGPIEPRIRRLTMRSLASVTTTITASSIVGINRDVGFVASDVGRLIRLQGNDTYWRSYKITTVTDATHVIATLLGDPLLGITSVLNWRLGLWCDTNGYPSVGEIHGDRLCLGSTTLYPNALAMSAIGAYEDMGETEPNGEVLETDAILVYIKSRKMPKIRWLIDDIRGLLAGTGAQSYLIAPTNGTDSNITPLNAKAQPGPTIGSAPVEPQRVGDEVLFVQRNNRTLRSLQYQYSANGFTGGYLALSLSQLASNLGSVGFVQIEYSAQPHSILWARRSDGSVVSFTYNAQEGVAAWGNQDFAGAIIESMAVIPQQDQQQDMLWLQTRRTINGVQKRYIEFMVQPWDFGDTLDGAHFVDCGIRYMGAPTTTVYGAQHLEGQVVYGLADHKPVGPLTVLNGSVTIPFLASNIVIGLGFDSTGTISRLENGATDGTAQGDLKRIHRVHAEVWDTACGQIGRYVAEQDAIIYDDLQFGGDLSVSEDIALHTGILEQIILEKGYDFEGTLSFRRPKETPLPFNLVALMPKMSTADGP